MASEVYAVIKKIAGVLLHHTGSMERGYVYFAVFKIEMCPTILAIQAAGGRAALLNCNVTLSSHKPAEDTKEEAGSRG